MATQAGRSIVRGPIRNEAVIEWVAAGGFLWFSSIRGRKRIGALVSDDVQEQAEQCFIYLTQQLHMAGAGLEHVVKMTIYMKDLSHSDIFNEYFLKYFPDPKVRPARITIQVEQPSAHVDPNDPVYFALDVIALEP